MQFVSPRYSPLAAYNQFQNYWDRSPYSSQCWKHSIPRAPFSMLLPFAIKFDESGRFGVKPNIEQGGGEGRGENI